MSMTRTLAATLVFALAAGAAQAQTPPAQTRPADPVDRLLSPAPTTDNPPPVNDGEAYHRADDSEQTPEELRITRALNDEVVSRNQLAENQEQAERIKHEEIVAAAARARLAYEEEARRANAAERDWQAEQARWQAENARWEADARACRAGDRSRCAPPR